MPFPIQLKQTEQSLQLQIGDNKLLVQNSDITSLAADAVVCPTNQSMDTKSGLAKILLKSAGQSVRRHRPVSPEPFGKVVVLPGGKLRAKYIFMTVLLGERGMEKMKLSISQAVERTVRYAEFLRLKSLAFPILGSAETLPPYEFIASQMLENVVRYFQKKNTKVKTIVFSVFNPDAFTAFCKEAESLANQ